VDQADACREQQHLVARALVNVRATGLRDDDEGEAVDAAALQAGWNAFVSEGGSGARGATWTFIPYQVRHASHAAQRSSSLRALCHSATTCCSLINDCRVSPHKKKRT